MRPAERFWASAHGSSWIAHYAASGTSPSRQWFKEAVHFVKPFSTVLDLGCNCGVLTSMLIDAGATQIMGIDVSVEALAEAKRRYPEHTWVLASVADWLPMLSELGTHADIVVSSSCLEHISTNDIDQTLRAMAAVATRAIVLQEVTTTPRWTEGASLTCGVPEWRHDYERRLGVLGWRRTVKYWLDVTSQRPAAVMVFEPEGGQR